MREDLKIISEWIQPGSHVLDLACGDGGLMQHLQTTRSVTGYGLEIAPNHIAECIAKGINVIQTDLDIGLADFQDNTFDYVIMTQSLQAMNFPARLIQEILRVGRQGIISFPNMGYWKCRLQLALGGYMPKTDSLPHCWYDTPNIHLCTIQDFEKLCRQESIEILQRSTEDSSYRHKPSIKLMPNLLAEVALYRFQKQQKT